MRNERVRENYLIDLKRHINFLKSEIENLEEQAYEMELDRREYTTEYEEIKSDIIIYESELEEKEQMLEEIYLEMEDEKWMLKQDSY